MAASGEDLHKEIHEHTPEDSEFLSMIRRLFGDVAASLETSGQHGAESPGTSGQHGTESPGTSGQLGTESPGTSGQLGTESPGTSGQLGTESPGTSGQLGTESPGTSGQLGAESPGTSGQLGAESPGTSGQLGAESPGTSGQLGTESPGTSGQLGTESPGTSGQLGTESPGTSGQLCTESPGTSGQLGTESPGTSGQLGTESPGTSGQLGTESPGTSGQLGTAGTIATSVPEEEGTVAVETRQSENPETPVTAQDGTASTDMRPNGASQIHEDRPHIMLNTVEAWRRENIYVTKSVEAVKEKISSKGCVCVIGVPGAGKSTALRYAALSLETDGFLIYYISGPDEFKYYDINKKQVFVLDDALGVYSVDQGKVKSWQEHNEKVRHALDSNTKLLVSIRTQIFMHETIKDTNIVFLEKSVTTNHVDFSDADYKLGIDDMRGMLTHYMTTHGVNVDNIKKVIGQLWPYTDKELTEMTENYRQHVMAQYNAGVEFSKCFPLLCKVFVNTDFVKQNPVAFFTNPFPALTKVFQNIKTDNKHQFCALVLCTMFDGKLTDDLLSPLSESPLFDNRNKQDKDKVELRNYIMSTYKLKCPRDLEDLQSALNSLTGVYILHVGDRYKISHAVFYDIVTYLYNDPLFVFKYGTREFIRDRVRLNNDSQQHDPYVIVYSGNTNIERLADRLIRDCMSDRETGDKYRPSLWKGAKIITENKYDPILWTGVRFITENPNINDDKLISCLRCKLTDRAQTDKTLINDLFLQCMWTVDNNSHIYKHGDVTQYKLIQTCLQVADVDCNQYILLDGQLLHISVMTGSLQLTRLLLHHGADKRRVNQFVGLSVLHWLCKYTKYNKVELVKLFAQGDLSVVDEEGRTIHDNILTHVDYVGRNILHYSVDDYDLTKHLLTYPCLQKDINKCDKGNRTPCSYIINNEKPDFLGGSENIVVKKKQDMIQLYKKHGARL